MAGVIRGCALLDVPASTQRRAATDPASDTLSNVRPISRPDAHALKTHRLRRVIILPGAPAETHVAPHQRAPRASFRRARRALPATRRGGGEAIDGPLASDNIVADEH